MNRLDSDIDEPRCRECGYYPTEDELEANPEECSKCVARLDLYEYERKRKGERTDDAS